MVKRLNGEGNDFQITEEDISFYREQGFLVVENLLPEEEALALQERLGAYTHGGRSTDKLGKIQIEPRVRRGELKVDHLGDGIRKVDGLVQGDDRYRRLGLHPKVVGLLKRILGPDIKMFRNAALLKPPSVGSPKGMHQDSPYWDISPMDLCSCWYAIDDATVENGCMQVLPGGHLKGALPHVDVTDDFVIDPAFIDMEELVSVPLKAGGGLFFHSLLPHYTAPNRSRKWRRAIALSYMSAQSIYTGGDPKPDYFQVCGKSYPDRV